jgi:WD40 repeat protein
VTGAQDGTIRGWEIATGQPIGPSLSHPNLFSIAVNPEGTRALTGSADGLLRFWRLNPPLPGEPEEIGRRLPVATGVVLAPGGGCLPLSPNRWDELRGMRGGLKKHLNP